MYVTYLLLLGSAIAINSILLIIVYRNSQKSLTIVTLIILLILLNIWFAPKLLTNAFHLSGDLFENMSRLAALGYVLTPATFLTFSLSYGRFNKVLNNVYYWISVLGSTLFYLYLSWTTNIVGVHEYSQAFLASWGYETPTGLLWPYYMIWFDSLMVASVVVLYLYYKKVKDLADKRETLLIMMAVSLPLVIGTITTGILPLFNIFVFPLGLVLADFMTILGVIVVYKFGWFVVSPTTILSSLSEMIVTVDKTGHILHMNPYSEKILKVRAINVIGKPLEDILIIKDKENSGNRLNNLLDTSLSKGKTFIGESLTISNIRRQTLPLTLAISPIKQDQMLVGANIFLKDNSAEKARSKQKDDFFAVMSHELRTPITSIRAYNQLLLSKFKQKSDSRRVIVSKMDIQLNRLLRLIQDFYELSELQSGKLKLEREFFAVDEFVLNLIDTMQVTYKNRTFQVEGLTNSTVYADKGRIEQVLINFLTNAMKYSPEDKQIVIRLLTNSKQICVGVQDFGSGIQPEFQDKIFKRFFRIEDAVRGKLGLGVGLFVASTIVRLHQGRIWVESKVGQGSVFYFSLPLSH